MKAGLSYAELEMLDENQKLMRVLVQHRARTGDLDQTVKEFRAILAEAGSTARAVTHIEPEKREAVLALMKRDWL